MLLVNVPGTTTVTCGIQNCSHCSLNTTITFNVFTSLIKSTIFTLFCVMTRNFRGGDRAVLLLAALQWHLQVTMSDEDRSDHPASQWFSNSANGCTSSRFLVRVLQSWPRIYTLEGLNRNKVYIRWCVPPWKHTPLMGRGPTPAPFIGAEGLHIENINSNIKSAWLSLLSITWETCITS